MGTDLGARLVQAGLVTRGQLHRALGRAPANEGALLAALAGAGVDEDGLAGFFIAHGLGPLVAPDELVPERAGTLARVPGRMAHALFALPLKETPAGLVVAMAAPTDAHARAELARTAGGQILPALARTTDLIRALGAAYPDDRPSDRPAVRDSEPPVLELVKRRPSAAPPAARGYDGSTTGVARVEARALHKPEEGEAVPLVRHKPVAPPAPSSNREASRPPRRLRKKAITRDFEVAPKERPPEDDVTDVDLMIDLTDLDADAGPTSPTPARGWSTTQSRTHTDAPLARAAQEAAERVARESRGPEERAKRPAHPPPPPSPPPPSPPPPSSAVSDPAPPVELRPRTASPSRPPSNEPTERTELNLGELGQPGAAEPSVAEPAPMGSAAPLPLTVAKSPKSPLRSIIPPDHDSWEPAPSPNKVDPQKVRRFRSSPPKLPPRPAPIGGTLAAIRASRRRDDVVELACQGVLTVARAGVLLALRKNVLKGLGGAGVGLSRDAIRNLWIPTSSPSMFRDVAVHQVPYAGAHGTSAADGLFRAALGSRGGDVALMPVLVGGKLVAVLAAAEVRFGAAGVERVEVLARAVGEALERIIVDSKKRD